MFSIIRLVPVMSSMHVGHSSDDLLFVMIQVSTQEQSNRPADICTASVTLDKLVSVYF